MATSKTFNVPNNLEMPKYFGYSPSTSRYCNCGTIDVCVKSIIKYESLSETMRKFVLDLMGISVANKEV